MKRGDIFLVREAGTPAAKARPCVIIQRDSTLESAKKVTVCALTSNLSDSTGVRPYVPPTAENGLTAPSQIEIDWIFTHPLKFVGPRIGQLDDDTMAEIDRVLCRWLDL